MNIDTLRDEFERQHTGRNLTRHRLRGTYLSAPIAALWNQHVRTANWTEHRLSPDQNEMLRIPNKVLAQDEVNTLRKFNNIIREGEWLDELGEKACLVIEKMIDKEIEANRTAGEG